MCIRDRLIDVYNRYRHVFSDTPGKVRDYQCEIEFREPFNYDKKILHNSIFVEGRGGWRIFEGETWITLPIPWCEVDDDDVMRIA